MLAALGCMSRSPPTHSSCTAGERLSEKETEELMAWMRNALGSRVTNVKVRPPSNVMSCLSRAWW